MSNRREVSSLPIKPNQVRLLLRHGFRTINDLKSVKPSELSSELEISPEEAKDILDKLKQDPVDEVSSTASSNSAPHSSLNNVNPSSQNQNIGRTAQEMYKAGREQIPIITFCKAIDTMLGGGIRSGEIVEICGVPGIGKTQFGMQLAIDAQIPEAFKGVGGETIYIDTEGSFMVERAHQIAAGVSKHLSSLLERMSNPIQRQAFDEFASKANGDSVLAFLTGIHVMRVHDHTEQLAAVANLKSLIKAHPKVKLVVIDSVAFHFRHGSSSVDFAQRSRLLAGMSQKLNEVAHKCNVAIVLTNQMTTKVDDSLATGGGGGGGSGRLVPALGESWAHAATHRLQLYWASDAASSGERKAKLIKSSSKAQSTVSYTVVKLGIRDVRTQPLRMNQQQQQQQPRQVEHHGNQHHNVNHQTPLQIHQQQQFQQHHSLSSSFPSNQHHHEEQISFTPKENLMFSPPHSGERIDGQHHQHGFPADERDGDDGHQKRHRR